MLSVQQRREGNTDFVLYLGMRAYQRKLWNPIGKIVGDIGKSNGRDVDSDRPYLEPSDSGGGRQSRLVPPLVLCLGALELEAEHSQKGVSCLLLS